MAKIAAELDYVGVLTGEFFTTDKGPVFNEMAPRVHKSGHWTIEGAVASQFENHIRAVAGLPPGSTATRALPGTMSKLSGSDIAALAALPADEDCHAPPYRYRKTVVQGKSREGRVLSVGAN